MEELYESEVMTWAEYQTSVAQGKGTSRCASPRRRNNTNINGDSASAAMAIPAARRPHSNELYEDGEEETEFVPPHVLVSRRRSAAGKTVAISVCSGQGRTLKGRDLSHARDSVLRMTGYLES